MPSKMLHEIASKKGYQNPFQSFDHREFLCGCGAALINIAITYPVYKMIFRQVRVLLDNKFFSCLINNFFF